MTDKTLDIDQLAEVLHLSPFTIKSALSKNPDRLPPRVQIRGLAKSKPIWLESVVFDWLKTKSLTV